MSYDFSLNWKSYARVRKEVHCVIFAVIKNEDPDAHIEMGRLFQGHMVLKDLCDYLNTEFFCIGLNLK